MKTWIQVRSNLIDSKWFVLFLSALILLLSALAGGIASGATWILAGKEIFLLAGLLGLCLVVLFSAARFDFVVWLSFCLFGVVNIEPAPTDLLIMLLLVLGPLVGKLSFKPRYSRKASLIHLAFWGFLVVNLASLIGMDEILAGSRFLFITIYLIAFTYFVKMYVTSFQAARMIMVGYLISALFSMGLVILGFLGVGEDIFIQYGIRAQALFKDTNVFGPFLILPTLFLIDELRRPCLLRGHYLAKLAGIVLLSAGIFLSGSRAAWGNLVVALLIYFALSAKHLMQAQFLRFRNLFRPRYFALFMLIALGLLVTILANQNFPDFLQTFIAERAKFQAYDTDRFARQLEGVHVGLTHLFGLGPGAWGNAHSLYARTFAEHGVFGLFFLLFGFFVLSIRTLFRAWQETDKSYGLSARILIAAIAGHLLNSFVIDTIHWRHFWLILALSWVVSTTKSLSSDPLADVKGNAS